LEKRSLPGRRSLDRRREIKHLRIMPIPSQSACRINLPVIIIIIQFHTIQNKPIE
jgi:hypothetical protein